MKQEEAQMQAKEEKENSKIEQQRIGNTLQVSFEEFCGLSFCSFLTFVLLYKIFLHHFFGIILRMVIFLTCQEKNV